MSNLKFSIVTLFVFVVALLGISNVRVFEESVIDFSPVFFILIAVVLFSELLIVGRLVNAGVRLSQYSVIAFWLIVYAVIWYSPLQEEKSIGLNLIQILLILLTAVLALDVGRRIDQTDIALDGLASSAYPNRAKDLVSAKEIISAEIARSRRYHYPLSILTLQLGKNKSWGDWKDMKLLASEILERFAYAKVSQIISDHARGTDVVLRSDRGQFVLLCPETNFENCLKLSHRIDGLVRERTGADLISGSAVFPDDALNFDDLMDVAQSRLENQKAKDIENKTSAENRGSNG